MPGVLLWGWDSTNNVWRQVIVDSSGRINIGSVADAAISQTTPQDLKHLPHGYYAAGGTYLPLAVNADGKLLLQTAALDHLDDIGDVDVPTPTDAYLLYWDAATSKWKCKALLDADIPATICRDTEADSKIATHSALPDAHHTKFTTTEHDVVARHPLANLDPLVCSQAEADSKVATHSGLTTGIHGVGAGTVGIMNQDKTIQDTDADTKVQAEKSADEDKIHMDVAGVEAFLLNNDGILDFAKQSGCSVYRATNQTIPTATRTKVQLNTEIYDIQGEFDPTTNYRFTAKRAGYYLVAGAVSYVTFPADKKIQVMIKKNGADIAINEIESAITDYISAFVLAIVQLAANDYIELYTAHWAGSNQTLRGGAGLTFMNIHKVA